MTIIETVKKTEIKTNIKQKKKLPSFYNIVFHNDDSTSMEFVVALLMKVFDKNYDEAYSLMMKVHEEGKAIVAFYIYEIAEMKRKQAILVSRHYNYPLQLSLEEKN